MNEAKRLMNAEGYERHQDFRREVLDVARREINAATDITVSCAPIKSGRKITGIRFTFRHKNDEG